MKIIFALVMLLAVPTSCFGQQYAIQEHEDGYRIVPARFFTPGAVLGGVSVKPKLLERMNVLEIVSRPFPILSRKARAKREEFYTETASKLPKGKRGPANAKFAKESDQWIKKVATPQQLKLIDLHRLSIGFGKHGIFVLEDPEARKIAGIEAPEIEAKLRKMRLEVFENLSGEFAKKDAARVIEFLGPEKIEQLFGQKPPR